MLVVVRGGVRVVEVGKVFVGGVRVVEVGKCGIRLRRFQEETVVVGRSLTSRTEDIKLQSKLLLL